MSDENCIFCLIAQGKSQSAKVFEDDACMAFLDIKPASKGHIQIIPKVHAQIFLELDEATRNRIFSIALSLGQNLIKKMRGATGISYIINEGVGANQRVAHASIHVIPRYEGDKVSISWPDKQLSGEELSDYVNSVISEIKSEQSAPAKKSAKSHEPAPEKKEKEDDIVLKPRIPKYW
ncbi:MAG: HIT family protein [Candidatus Nanoarchaeia archaeon]|nr:HIT family protein [Candidatus Nanoarchaeia archaeon]MDD5054343.1 HIT family protein [Candidatus Nanoarchaeia archaeon]MDD5500045.1 HIT family protein [Candidatus Nanoarchaeia archaeon]